MTTCKLPARPVLLLVAVLLALTPTARAEDADETEGEILFGPQYYLDTDNRGSAKFEEYRDVPNDFVAERFFFSWRRDKRWFLKLDGVDIAQHDQRLALDFGKPDLWHGTIRWAENPRRWTDQASTLFTESRPGVFTLEDTFQSAVQAAPAAADADADLVWDPGTKGRIIQDAIADSASAVFLGHQRETGGVAFQVTPNRHWTFGLNAQRERREGTTPQTLGVSMGGGRGPAEVAAPLDFRTDTASASLEYAAARFNVGVQVLASQFDTGSKSLIWDNPLSLNDTASNSGRGRLTLAADNELTRWSAHGGVNLPAHTRIDASIAVSETTQDDPFLPMTINSLLAAAPLPAADYDGEHETTVAQLRISSRPMRLFRWGAWWRSWDMKNRTPKLTFLDYVQADTSFPLCGNPNLPCDIGDDDDVTTDRLPRRSLPYAHSRNVTGALVGFSPVQWFDASFGYEQEDTEREHAAVEVATEDIYKLTLDFDVAGRLGIRTTLRRQERRADAYHAHYFEESFPNGEAYVAGFNEGSRKFYWTDRDRDAQALQFDLALTDAWSLYGEASNYDNEYFDPETGLPIGRSFTVQEDRDFNGTPETYDLLLAGRTQDEGDSQTLGVAYTGGRVSLYVDYTLENFEYALASRYRGITAGVGTDDPLDDWSSAADDDYDTANLGFDYRLTEGGSWRVHGDISYSKGTSLITTDFVPGGATSGDTTLTEFPEIETTLELATLALKRRARENLEYGLTYAYESWEEDNFASDFNEPYMGAPDQDPASANAVFLGIDFKNYTNHIVSFLMHLRF